MARERKVKRQRNTGSLFTPPGSNVIWCQFYVNGQRYRESTNERNERKAESYLRNRLAEVAVGTFDASATKVTIAELAKDYFDDLRANKAKDSDRAERRWKTHLESRFAHLRAAQLTTSFLRRFIKDRQEEGAANGTINRELSALQRMFTLAHEENDPPKVRHVPYFPRLKENNPRAGFVEAGQYERIANECSAVGLWLRGIFEVGFTYGWRDSEVTGLRVSRVDLFNKGIRLWRGETKNNDGRLIEMTSAVYELLRRCVGGKSADDYVFTRDDATPINDFRKTWWGVCVRAGVGHYVCRNCSKIATANKCECGATLNKGQLKYIGLLFHDLRRTAIRNMVRRGVQEHVAMLISGHKTRAVFDRYNIVSEGDLKEAARKIEQGAQEEKEKLAEFNQSLAKVAQETVQVDKRRTIN